MLPDFFSELEGSPRFKELITEIQLRNLINPIALPRAVRLPLIVALHKKIKGPLIYIIAHADQAHVILDELNLWAPEIQPLFFAEPPALFYEKLPWGENIRWDRIRTLSSLANKWIPTYKEKPEISLVITTVKAMMTRTLPRREFLTNCQQIQIGKTINLDAFLKKCVFIGYEGKDIVTTPGQISRRGGIVDVWTPSDDFPIRIEFFGNEVETIRTFDPITQRSIIKLTQILIPPAREILPGKLSEIDPNEIQDTLEFRIPEAYQSPSSLFDYLPDNSLIVTDDESYLQNVSIEIEEQSLQFRREAIENGQIKEDSSTPYLSWSELLDTRSKISWLDLGFSNDLQTKGLAELFSSPLRFGGNIENFIESIKRMIWKNCRVVIISRQASRLEDLWKDQNAQIEYSPLLRFIDASLSQGFISKFPERNPFYIFTDNEIFGWERPQPRRKTKIGTSTPESHFADLKAGDWVVHIDYGIGHFLGLVKRNLEGAEREFLCIEFADNDQLFVPVHQADRITPYIGPDDRPPKPTRLGGTEWQSTKVRVRGAVRQVAWDLLDLYARRQLAKGISFHPDTVWQKELEASFPYVETEDQAKAIEEVKTDMENERPMDRLLCGDVGYGKTEVALRAAFKAVMDGKQVAVLVPTTILAQQHYETFLQRLTPFPVKIEMLSRFRSYSEQENIIRQLEIGEVDIVIGTHRLIQPDVKFKDLGLLIIDEEQRFGVANKEYFKKLRTELDVLTLTATPIPRTLYMSLSGVKDISVINTPPSDRLPIATYVGPYDPVIVRRAILRELDRKGQIYFVHNRVQTIAGMANHLKHLVPEARIAIAHGQMHESVLSEVMHQFTKGEVDVLLSTSIIESGLDIPNVNTLILDRGDTFGLAQLYQLRGRVGRGSQRAFAYFFFNSRNVPTEDGRERLEIIAENTQLGAGYSIAMRDLEMRGAGDLRGAQQHGHIAAVGFHLYTRLLAQTVNQLRQEHKMEEHVVKDVLSVNKIKPLVLVELPISVSIPMDYVKDQNVRVQLYRRLADVQQEKDLDAIREEFQDRFGPLVEDVENLLFQLRIRLLAEKAGIASISKEGEQIILRFPPLAEGQKARSLPLLGENIRASKNTYWVAFTDAKEEWKLRLILILQRLIEIQKNLESQS